MIRMLLVGYCLGIRSERRLCDEVHLNLAYRWFCSCRPSRGGARPTPVMAQIETLAWLANDQHIEPHIPVFDKSGRKDGTFSRDGFSYDQAEDVYICPGSKTVTTAGTLVNDEATLLYRASDYDCDACELKSRCCPNSSARKIPRPIHETARDRARAIAKTDAYVTSRRERRRSRCYSPTSNEFSARPAAVARPLRCPRRIPLRRHCAEPAQDGQVNPDDAARTHHLRRDAMLPH